MREYEIMVLAKMWVVDKVNFGVAISTTWLLTQ